MKKDPVCQMEVKEEEGAFSSGWPRRDLLKFFLGTGLVALGQPLSFLGCTTTPPEIPQNRPDHAVERFMKSMNCAQAVLETYAPGLGMPVLMARRVPQDAPLTPVSRPPLEPDWPDIHTDKSSSDNRSGNKIEASAEKPLISGRGGLDCQYAPFLSTDNSK